MYNYSVEAMICDVMFVNTVKVAMHLLASTIPSGLFTYS